MDPFLISAGVGLLTNLFGGGKSSSKPAASPAAAGLGPLDQLMLQQAYKEGMTQAMGGSGAPVVPRVKVPGMPDYDANQRGGANYSPTLGRQDGAGAGSGRESKQQDATPVASAQGRAAVLPTLYNSYLAGRMSGTPQPGQLTSALGTINAQAARGMANINDNLGARGMLHSGITAGGMGAVEQGRLAAIGQFLNNLQAQTQAGQDTAARLYAADRAQTNEIAARYGLLDKQIGASKPTAWDYLAGALGAWAGSESGSQWISNQF